jgi:hypothetical protein
VFVYIFICVCMHVYACLYAFEVYVAGFVLVPLLLQGLVNILSYSLAHLTIESAKSAKPSFTK